MVDLSDRDPASSRRGRIEVARAAAVHTGRRNHMSITDGLAELSTHAESDCTWQHLTQVTASLLPPHADCRAVE